MDARELDPGAILALYEAVGWSGYTRDPAKLSRAIAGSSRIAAAFDGAVLVGLARVVSDGESILYLQDVLVHPGRQRAGLGRALRLTALLTMVLTIIINKR